MNKHLFRALKLELNHSSNFACQRMTPPIKTNWIIFILCFIINYIKFWLIISSIDSNHGRILIILIYVLPLISVCFLNGTDLFIVYKINSLLVFESHKISSMFLKLSNLFFKSLSLIIFSVVFLGNP